MKNQEFLSRRSFLSASAASGLFLLGCGGSNQGTYEAFRVKEFGCNKLRAENGETLTLNWDYGNPSLLKAQKLRFLRLHLSGIAQEIVDLTLDQRSFTFTFNGPVTVEIQASTEAPSEQSPFFPRFSAALNVNKLQDLFFRGTFRSGSNSPLFPYLGYPQDNQGNLLNQEVTIEFTQFAGFFDANNNGNIDPLSQFLPSTEAFRGISIGGIEAQGFGFREGPRFPFQLFNNPGIGRTNGMIYAGAIVMTGQPLPYKAGDGDGVGRASVNTAQAATTRALGFDPIFVGLPMLEAGANLTLADIQLGNLNQKLVTTVFTNPLQLSTSSLGTINTLTVNRQTSVSTGNIKGARSGLTVTPNGGGGPFDALVDISSLEWTTEYMRDEDILTVLTTGQQ